RRGRLSMSNAFLSRIWSIRSRIVLSITGLLLVFLAATVLVSRYQVGEAIDRKNYLKKHLGRFDASTTYVGNAMSATATTIASDQTLIRCLGQQPAPPPIEDQPPPAPCSPLPRWQEIQRNLAATLEPDLLMLTGPRDGPVGKAPDDLTGERLRRQLFFQRVAQGMTVSDFVELAGKAYLASGAPIKDEAGKRVGAVIIGIELDRLFLDFARQSDDNKAKRQNLFFIVDGRVLGSSFGAVKIDRGTVAEAYELDNRLEDQEGNEEIEILQLDGTKYDFNAQRRSVFVGDKEKPGDLVMARIRTAFLAKRDRIENPILVTGVVSLLISILLGFFVARSITRPLRGFIGYTEMMARGGGDLTHRFPVEGTDELALLARNLNAMLDQLQVLFNGVKAAALEVGNSAAEISVTAGQLHQRSREESVKVEEITNAVSEMNQMIQDLSVHSQQAAEHAKTGGEAVGDASNAILDIRKTVVDVSEHVKTLGERSARIGNIVETIGQIADQTSLLALNASIEAAHAGEHGKGFAVVANEVSNLAERVNKSARQIEEQLAQIRLLTEQAVRRMGDATSTVDAGVVKVDSTFQGLNEMMGLVQEIGEREKEQAVVSDNIARNMEDIFLLVREGLSASEQTVTEGDRLKRLGEALLASVAQFKTEAAAHDAGSEPRSLPAHASKRPE
ncbi:MAG: methyl-accepting chemotaxis protein, partial [Myxococcota bacterium]